MAGLLSILAGQGFHLCCVKARVWEAEVNFLSVETATCLKRAVGEQGYVSALVYFWSVKFTSCIY